MLKKKFSIILLIIRFGIEKYFLKNFPFFAPSSAGNYKILALVKKSLKALIDAPG